MRSYLGGLPTNSEQATGRFWGAHTTLDLDGLEVLPDLGDAKELAFSYLENDSME